MVENLIRERENYQENVIAEVSDKWGKHQTITALILTVPYYTYSTVKNEDNSEKKWIVGLSAGAAILGSIIMMRK